MWNLHSSTALHSVSIALMMCAAYCGSPHRSTSQFVSTSNVQRQFLPPWEAPINCCYYIKHCRLSFLSCCIFGFIAGRIYILASFHLSAFFLLIQSSCFCWYIRTDRLVFPDHSHDCLYLGEIDYAPLHFSHVPHFHTIQYAWIYWSSWLDRLTVISEDFGSLGNSYFNQSLSLPSAGRFCARLSRRLDARDNHFRCSIDYLHSSYFWLTNIFWFIPNI